MVLSTEQFKKCLPLRPFDNILSSSKRFILLTWAAAHSEAQNMIYDVDQPPQSMIMLVDRELAGKYIFQESSYEV